MNAEQIKDLYSMKDILERYGLQQPNRAGFIRCPFHREKTASMKIYKGSCYCFGCNFGGDIFDFAQKMDGLSFKEAFAMLGGSYDSGFSARKRIYQAQKKREMERKAGERLKRERELNRLLMEVYRRWLGRLEPLSEAWADAYNALQRQEYLWEVLNNPEECYEAIK